jgi:hypothetical protein
MAQRSLLRLVLKEAPLASIEVAWFSWTAPIVNL